jgi:hypothetical protein
MNTGSFFEKLFDFSFREFLTLQLVKYLYSLGIIYAAITGLSMLIGGVLASRYDVGKGITDILLSPLVFIMLTLLARLVVETLIAIFRIAESMTTLVEQDQRKAESDKTPGRNSAAPARLDMEERTIYPPGAVR